MRFSKPWATFPEHDGEERRPALEVYFRVAHGGLHRRIAVVDSGADISMGSRALCDALGLDWKAGAAIRLRGISQREDCAVEATIHRVDLLIREANCEITIPFCFAAADAPLLLGRDGFFDAFRVTFDKHQFITVFERF